MINVTVSYKLSADVGRNLKLIINKYFNIWLIISLSSQLPLCLCLSLSPQGLCFNVHRPDRNPTHAIWTSLMMTVKSSFLLH